MSKPVIIFDLDGTLSNCGHRLHYIWTKDKDWQAYHEACDLDSIVQPMATLLNNCCDHLDEQLYVFICSGRPESVRAKTVKWLDDAEISYDRLYLRDDADFRPNDVVKREMLQTIRADSFEPILAIEDQYSVVKMWRSEGICCLQASGHSPRPVESTADGDDYLDEEC